MDPELPLPEMSSQPPEQIPMPAPPTGGDDRGAPPTSYTRELSPQEKSNALIQFMGVQYGELNQLDGQIEGHAALGKGSSQKIKQQVAQVLENTQVGSPAVSPSPVAPQQQQVPPPPPAAVPVLNITPPEDEPVDPNQLEFNFNVNEKQELLSMVRALVDNVKTQRKEIAILTDKVDDLIKSSKKKSPRLPRKAVDKTSKV